MAIRKSAWEEEKKTISLYDTNKLLTQWKVAKPGSFRSTFASLTERTRACDWGFKPSFAVSKRGEKEAG